MRFKPLYTWLIIFMIGISLNLQAQKTAAFQDPERTYKEALEIYDQQKYNIAYNKFKWFIERYEKLDDSYSNIILGDAYYYLAASAGKQKDPKTEDYYLAYLKKFKGHSFTNNAYLDLGNWYFDIKNYKDALAYYQRVNERPLGKEAYGEYVFKKGFCYFSTKKFEEAKAQWQDVIRENNSKYYHMANYYYGMAAYYTEDFQTAIDAFQISSAVSRYKAVIPYYITQIKFLENDYQGVIDYAVPMVGERATKNKADINQLIGQSYFELGNYEEAVQYLSEYEKKARTLTKEDYYQLGYAQYEIGDYEGAVRNFKELNHLNNALAQNALFLTGKAYLKLGDKENARTAIQRASKLKYDETIVEEAKFSYAKLSYELGYNNDALNATKQFVEQYPNSKYIGEANELLANVLLQTRNFTEALRIIETIQNPSVKIQEAYQLMAYQKGIAEYNNGRLNRALDAFNKAERYTNDRSIFALTKYWRGDIYHRKGQYEQSIPEIKQFLANSASVKTKDTEKVNAATGNYVQGYNYYKLKDYNQAQQYFEQATSSLGQSSNAALQNKILPDALLRTADCYFIKKNYNAALNFYDKVINKGYEGADYSYFQKGIIEGLKGSYEAKINQLKKVISVYPNSVLVDDAKYEIGSTYVLQKNNAQAKTMFNDIVQKHGKGDWVAPSYLKLGLIYFNEDNYEESLRQYKKVVSRYPKTAASAEALIAIKDVYIAKGDPQGYVRYLNNVPDADVTVSAQDSITYLSAENQFTQGNYDGALKSFNDYILRYPNGYFSLSARFYRGECYFSFQEFNKALEDYNFVLLKPQNRFTEKSTQRAASINYYHTKDYRKAKEQYTALIGMASTPDVKNAAIIGVLRTSNELKDYTETIEFANRVTSSEAFSEQQQTEAYYYRAKALWESGNKSNALVDYVIVKTRTNNQWAAEATYMQALHQYEQGDLTASEATCFDFVRNYPSYATWLVRTYLILADIYIQQDNLFKAKATMQSILDNYKTDDEWRRKAQQKYAEIERLEGQNSKIALPDSESNELKFDDN